MSENNKEKKGFFSKLVSGLTKTRNQIADVFGNVFGLGEINEDFYEELEEALIVADTGVTTTQNVLEKLKVAIKEQRIKERKEAKIALIKILSDSMRSTTDFANNLPVVILVVGVNGVGKTTTIGKMAHYYKSQGKSVMLCAADTFRAAATEQLVEWAQRSDVPIIKHQEGADPAAVVFDAVASAKAKHMDILICDTAGRLHNKVNLMNELSKMSRVITREFPDAELETLLVLDATTGQNAIAQAKVFAQTVPLTGIVLTKLDGTAKGGVVIGVQDELKIPVRFIGVGEAKDDLQPFDPDDFATALFATNEH